MLEAFHWPGRNSHEQKQESACFEKSGKADAAASCEAAAHLNQ
jgi:hypothetical protein